MLKRRLGYCQSVVRKRTQQAWKIPVPEETISNCRLQVLPGSQTNINISFARTRDFHDCNSSENRLSCSRATENFNSAGWSDLLKCRASQRFHVFPRPYITISISRAGWSRRSGCTVPCVSVTQRGWSKPSRSERRSWTISSIPMRRLGDSHIGGLETHPGPEFSTDMWRGGVGSQKRPPGGARAAWDEQKRRRSGEK